VKGRIQGTGLDSQHIAGVRLDGKTDTIPVLGAPLKGGKDKEVERALQKLDSVAVGLLLGLHSYRL
jgi:hypothetical protein